MGREDYALRVLLNQRKRRSNQQRSLQGANYFPPIASKDQLPQPTPSRMSAANESCNGRTVRSEAPMRLARSTIQGRVRLVNLMSRCRRGTPSACRASKSHWRSEEHTSELQSLAYLVCRLLLEKKKKKLDRAQREH